MEVSDFLGENVATLYRHFDEFKTKAMYFMTELPFEVKYELTAAKGRKPLMEIRLVHAPIPIGALFLCWQSNPELFRAPCSTPDKEYLIYSFNGSPLSGANCWSAVCLETGERISGNADRNFRKRCECLDEAVLVSQQMLAEYKKRKGVDVLIPATLEELVEFINTIKK